MRYVIYGIVILILAAGVYAGYSFLTTKNHSPADTLVYQDGDFLLTLDYSRPFKKNRLIFGSDPEKALIPYGKYWRTGANEASEIEFNRDINISDKQLKAGRYRFYTIPGEKEWILAFNSELGKWGYAEPDYSLDVLRIKTSPLQADSVFEQFLIIAEPIQADQLTIKLLWDQTMVPIKINY